jgi:hypothetical protein
VIAARRNATVPVNPVARRVARRFLETAVGRNDLATAYPLVGPMMKGVTRAKWIKGHNPVTYYPSSNLRTAPMTVKASRKSALMLEVVLKRRPKVAGIPTSYAFDLQVIRIRGKWLVNYFMPYPTEPGRFANT